MRVYTAVSYALYPNNKLSTNMSLNARKALYFVTNYDYCKVYENH